MVGRGVQNAGRVTAAVILILVLHEVFWFDNGRYHLVIHRGLPDQFMNFGEVSLALLMGGLGLPAAVLLARSFDIISERAVDWLKKWLEGRIALLLLAGGAALGAFLIAHFVHGYAWFTDDEQAYLYQAKSYLNFELTGEILQPRAAFEHAFVVVVGEGESRRWAGVYPALQPFLMSLSMRLGNANLSQFLTVGFLVYNAGRFAETYLSSRRAGFIVSGLCVTSPMLLGLGSTYHTAVLSSALSVATARLLLWLLAAPSLLRASALGACAGTIVLARPMEGTLMVGMTGLLLLVWSVRATRYRVGRRGFSLVGYAFGGAIPLVVFLLVNRGTSGEWLAGPYKILEEQIGGFFGFGDRMMWGRTHSPSHGLSQTVSALLRLNNWLFAWPISLAAPLLALSSRFYNPRIALLVAISAIQLGAYFFLAFGSVHDFGSAYHVWHLPWMATATAWVILRAQVLLGTHSKRIARRPYWFAAALTIVGLATFWPAQLVRWKDVGEVITGPIREAERAAGKAPAIILWSQIQPPGNGLRSWVFRAPAPYPGDHILWVRDHPSYYPALKKNFPSRAFHRLSWQGRSPAVTRVVLP